MISFEAIYHNLIKEVIFYYINVEFIKINILQVYIFILLCACESLNHVQLFPIPWTVGHQAPLSMEFSRQEYWSGLPFPTSGDQHL